MWRNNLEYFENYVLSLAAALSAGSYARNK
jgi:hypothetical protein